MSTLKDKAQEILDEKIAKIKPENIKKDIQIFDVIGILDEELPILDITVPNSIDIDLQNDTQTIVLNDTPYISDVTVYLSVYSKLKNSSEDWQISNIANIDSKGNIYNSDNKMAIQFYMRFWGSNADEYDYKIDMTFVKENYLAKVISTLCNLIIPTGVKLYLQVEDSSGGGIKDIFTNPNDITITDDEDNIISGLDIIYEDEWYTDTFGIYSLPIGNYKVKINYNSTEVFNSTFAVDEYDMSIQNQYSKHIYAYINGIYKFEGTTMHDRPVDGQTQTLYFAKAALTRLDDNDDKIDEDLQISPQVLKRYVLDGGTKLRCIITKPGYNRYERVFSNAELTSTPWYELKITHNIDISTHNSIDIIIGPWKDEQAGKTSAAPDDLDISIYLQDDNDEYVLVDESIGYYAVNHDVDLSAVVIFGKINQNVKLVLNDSRYTFQNGLKEEIFAINEWGYTTGLYPVEQE